MTSSAGARVGAALGAGERAAWGDIQAGAFGEPGWIGWAGFDGRDVAGAVAVAGEWAGASVSGARA
ncbi:hypothetical protein ABK046_35790 [Streptomyces caeruleatus]